MKFELRSLKNMRSRLGVLYDVERLPTLKLDTPNLLFYTNSGSIPHLTYEVLQMLTTDTLPLQIPLDNIYHANEAVKKSNSSLNSFIGLPEYLSYCVLQDPTATIEPRHHRENVATIWSIAGKQFITAKRYMELMESFKPDMYVSLCDGDTNLNSSNKRISNSLRTSNHGFSYCYNHHISSPILCKKGLIAAVEGGYNLYSREICAKYLSDFPILGYLIDGLHSDGKSVHEIPFHPVENVITHTLKYLPEKGLRIVHGAWEPQLILKMIKLGIDLFDTSFPSLNAENGCALTFNFAVNDLFDENVELVNFNKSVNEIDSDDCENKFSNKNELETSSFFTDNNESNNNIKILQSKNNVEDKTNSANSQTNSSPYSVSLRDPKFFDDFTPLVENCACLTCRKHTKAYIHHLLLTKELLGFVLLMIHNLHHYMEFFRLIREHLRQNENRATE